MHQTAYRKKSGANLVKGAVFEALTTFLELENAGEVSKYATACGYAPTCAPPQDEKRILMGTSSRRRARLIADFGFLPAAHPS